MINLQELQVIVPRYSNTTVTPALPKIGNPNGKAYSLPNLEANSPCGTCKLVFKADDKLSGISNHPRAANQDGKPDEGTINDPLNCA